MDFDLLLSSPFYLTKSKIRQYLTRYDTMLTGRLLDIGCGSRSYQKLLHYYSTYVGMEVNARQRPNVVGDALNLPFPSAIFDSILCLEVLEHLPEPERALAEMGRVIRPGGILLLTTPMTWYLHYEPHDYFRYTHYGLTYLLQKAGFKVRNIDRTGGLATIVLSRLVEAYFHIAYRFTIPIRWLTGLDRGRWKIAVILTIPATLVALALKFVLERKNGLYVQGWTLIAEKEPNNLREV